MIFRFQIRTFHLVKDLKRIEEYKVKLGKVASQVFSQNLFQVFQKLHNHNHSSILFTTVKYW